MLIAADRDLGHFIASALERMHRSHLRRRPPHILYLLIVNHANQPEEAVLAILE